MNEFDDRSEGVVMLAAITASLCSQQTQHRSQALATGVDNVMTELVNQHDVGCQTPLNQRINSLHIRSD